MKVILSDVLEDKFTQFVVVKNFKDVKNLKGVSTLIVHHYSETELDAGIFISDFRALGITQFVYISENPDAIMLALMKGVDGVVFTDEFYFEDEEELLVLLEDLDNMDTDTQETGLATSSLTVIQDFMSAFSRNESRIRAPIYLERVTQAINELSVVNQEQETQLIEMGAGTLAVFERASSVIRSINENSKLLQKKLDALEVSVVNTPSKSNFSNSVIFFAPYKYMGNSRVLLIREYAPCRYLTSFVLGYLHHVHYELNRRPKLIFVHQKGQGVSAKYSDFTAITQDSMGMQSLYDNEIIATNNPKKEVMQELMSKHNDVIIIVDRLYSTQDIVTGRVRRVNAVGSRSDIARYKLKPEDTIFSITSQAKQLFHLPNMKNFPIETDARYATYSQLMQGNYRLLDERIGIKVDGD